MCPPLPGARGLDNFWGDSSVASSLERASLETDMSESLPPEIKEQIFDLPSFITPEQRNYVGERILNICTDLEKHDKDQWNELKFENEIEVQKLFVKLAKNYFDGSTTLEAVQYYENLTREHLDYICSKFGEFLLLTEGPDPLTNEFGTLFRG